MSLLERILARKREEVAGLPPVPPRSPARALTPGPSPDSGRGVASTSIEGSDAFQALHRPRGAPLRLIAEVKFRSPSAGSLSRKMSAAQRAVAYAEGGAAMVSVLCDETFFGGGYLHLTEARLALDKEGRTVPLLAKEFVIDPVQLEWASHHGADAALLIARIVDRGTLGALVKRARALDLEPFVEVTTEAERDAALEAGARVVGVNARDLDTLEMDAERTARVIAGIPPRVVAVHLSGLGSPAAVRAVAGGRADAALVGEALMRVDDPGPVLRDFVSAARGG
jgi:indole-3-glycerol phosphate synthase